MVTIAGQEFTAAQFLDPNGMHPSGQKNLPAFVGAILAAAAGAVVGAGQEGEEPEAERAFPQVFELTRNIWAVQYRGRQGNFYVTFSFYRPDGLLVTKEYTLPEQARAALATLEVEGTGDDLITAAYTAGLPQAQADFRAAWGLPEPE